MRDASAEFRRILVQPHTMSVFVFLFWEGLLPFSSQSYDSMCQRETMIEKLGSAFSFGILISAICLLGHVLLLIFVLFHTLHLLGL